MKDNLNLTESEISESESESSESESSEKDTEPESSGNEEDTEPSAPPTPNCYQTSSDNENDEDIENNRKRLRYTHSILNIPNENNNNSNLPLVPIIIEGDHIPSSEPSIPSLTPSNSNSNSNSKSTEIASKPKHTSISTFPCPSTTNSPSSTSTTKRKRNTKKEKSPIYQYLSKQKIYKLKPPDPDLNLYLKDLNFQSDGHYREHRKLMNEFHLLPQRNEFYPSFYKTNNLRDRWKRCIEKTLDYQDILGKKGELIGIRIPIEKILPIIGIMIVKKDSEKNKVRIKISLDARKMGKGYSVLVGLSFVDDKIDEKNTCQSPDHVFPIALIDGDESEELMQLLGELLKPSLENLEQTGIEIDGGKYSSIFLSLKHYIYISS